MSNSQYNSVFFCTRYSAHTFPMWCDVCVCDWNTTNVRKNAVVFCRPVGCLMSMSMYLCSCVVPARAVRSKAMFKNCVCTCDARVKSGWLQHCLDAFYRSHMDGAWTHRVHGNVEYIRNAQMHGTNKTHKHLRTKTTITLTGVVCAYVHRITHIWQTKPSAASQPASQPSQHITKAGVVVVVVYPPQISLGGRSGTMGGAAAAALPTAAAGECVPCVCVPCVCVCVCVFVGMSLCLSAYR